MDSTGVSVFAISSDELKGMITAHMDSVRAGLAKVVARIAIEEQAASGIGGGAAFSSVKDILGSSVVQLENRLKESQFLLDHVETDGYFRMSAAHLLGFRAAFGPIVVDCDKAIFGADEAPVPSRQAERSVKEALIQVPRLSLPGGILAG